MAAGLSCVCTMFNFYRLRTPSLGLSSLFSPVAYLSLLACLSSSVLVAQVNFADEVNVVGNVGVWGDANIAGNFNLDAAQGEVSHFGSELAVAASAIVSGTGDWIFEGSTAQTLKGGYDQSTASGPILFDLVVDNDSHLHLANSDAKIRSTFQFQNGKAILDGNDLIVGHASAGTMAGYTQDKYVVTGAGVSGGKLYRENVGNARVDFPVGTSITSYTPASIQNSGTADVFGVRVFDGRHAEGTSGNSMGDDCPGKTWDIVEGTAGGSNVTLSLQHNRAEEGSKFDSAKHFVSHYVGTAPNGNTNGNDTISNNKWDLLKHNQLGSGSTTGTITTGTPIARASVMSRSGITSFSPFSKSNYLEMLYCVVPKVYLQGALINASNSTMTDDLRSKSLIPTTEPYTNLTAFVHKGKGGNESTTSTVLGITGNNAIVDWVFLEFRDTATNTTVVETRAALLQRDGDVVDTDGSSAVCLSNPSVDSFFVAIRHRNHLGVMAKDPVQLTPAGRAVDFSTVDLYGSHATKKVNNVEALWAGDVKMNGDLKYEGSNNDAAEILNEVLAAPKNTLFGGSQGYTYRNVYRVADVNMNGEVKYEGSSNDAVIILNNIMSYPNNNLFGGSQGYTNLKEQLPK